MQNNVAKTRIDKTDTHLTIPIYWQAAVIPARLNSLGAYAGSTGDGGTGGRRLVRVMKDGEAQMEMIELLCSQVEIQINVFLI